MANKILVLGISGVTCGGKTTLATELDKFLPKSKIISQDDYFLDVNNPQHVWIQELNHINFDILSSLDMEKMHNDIKTYMDNTSAHFSNNKTDVPITPYVRNIYEKIRELAVEVLIIEGFSIFNYQPLKNIFQLKYYLTLPKEECLRRRMQRVYEPPNCPGYFEICAWPEHIKQLEEVRAEVEDVKYFDENSKNCLENILCDIVTVST